MSSPAKSLIEDPANDIDVSPASYWEIAIKISVGKYTLAKPYVDFMAEAIDKNGFGYLHIEPKHTAALTKMPFHHRDPFDRLLIAQAKIEKLTIMTPDKAFGAYDVPLLW